MGCSPESNTGFAPQEHASFLALSPRERQVLQCTADGLTVDETITQLGISRGTIETYRRQIGFRVGKNSLTDNQGSQTHSAMIMLIQDGIENDHLQHALPDQYSPSALTPRESEVLNMVTKGKTLTDIAREFKISNVTITVHMSHIHRKLGTKNSYHLAARVTSLKVLGIWEKLNLDGSSTKDVSSLPLSPRVIEVLQQMSDGKTVRETGETMGVSEYMVNYYRSRIGQIGMRGKKDYPYDKDRSKNHSVTAGLIIDGITMGHLKHELPKDYVPERLTPAEHTILQLILQGKTLVDISKILWISYKTMEAHSAHIHKKLGTSTLCHLIARATYLEINNLFPPVYDKRIKGWENGNNDTSGNQPTP